MRYFNNPPKIKTGRLTGNYPRFMKKWYQGKVFDTQFVLDLFSWGEREYTDTKNWAISQMNEQLYKFVSSLSSLNVVATSKEFKELFENMNQELWNTFPKSVQNALYQTALIYTAK